MIPDSLFETEGNVSLSVLGVLSRALEYDPMAPFAIIVTNFRGIAVFFPPSYNNPRPSFERVSSTQLSLALQVISAACIYTSMPGFWIDSPDPGYEFLLPQGPVQNPDEPMLSDDQLLATHHRHSDFDIPTLLRNKARALQFFRWHDHIQHRLPKLVAKPNDVLQAVSNAFDSIPLRPLYQFDFTELPEDTIKHITETKRPSALQVSGIMERFMRSKSFLVEIQDIISAGSKRGICTLYRCKIISIDNKPVALSPNLCLKLFDDRFQDFHECTQEEVSECDEESLSRWFCPLIMTESLITNEILAYNKLQPVQGSVIPWFYGAHRFTLPDGIVLDGLLMEYIEGQEVNANIEPALSHERQIKMIHSCRHAVRILDVGDIGQQDWHSGQILLSTTTQIDHVILIDFGITTQTYEGENLNFIGNYCGILDVLRYQNSTLDLDLVWKHFGRPDDWDPIDIEIEIMPRRSARLAGSTAVRTSAAVKLESLETDVAVGHHENSPGPDSERSDESVRPHKRRKQSKPRKHSKPNASSLHPSLQFKNVRGRRGALKDIVEMPFDILHEIFMYLTPVEVLSLSRMCKALRRILMTKTAEYVWKQARLNLDDFPDCPDDLNEPQFANFIFSSLSESLAVTERDLICEASANQLVKEFNKIRISDLRAQEAWMEEQKDERQRRITHGRLCERWLRKQDHQRADQLVEIRNRRYEAIKQRLIGLGWGKELETIKGMQQWPSVRQQKDLTDRIWQNIKDDIIDKMEDYRAYRLQEDYLTAQRNRRSLLNKCLRDLQQKHLGKLIFPDISDIETTDQISTLIKAPTEETIDFPESLMLEFAQNWRESSDTVLRGIVTIGPTLSSKVNGADPLLLATTFFSCWKRNYGCNVLFQYPEVLKKHDCATFVPERDRCLWNIDGKRVLFSDKAYSLAREILEAAGFDPDTTMREDVQWPAFIVECHECSILKVDNGVRILMSWPAAIKHAIEHDRRRQPPLMVRADLSDTERKQVHELAVKDVAWHKDDLLCVRCKEPRFRGCLFPLERHIRHKHQGAYRDLIYSTDYVFNLEISGLSPEPVGYLFLRPNDVDAR
ncbi:hypothetical protein C0992_010002 [Termitomyces sp. T32_za158]|nr:hypothetical protein C0992_010002 [Termitomyces sp. T32_za158]